MADVWVSLQAGGSFLLVGECKWKSTTLVLVHEFEGVKIEEKVTRAVIVDAQGVEHVTAFPSHERLRDIIAAKRKRAAEALLQAEAAAKLAEDEARVAAKRAKEEAKAAAKLAEEAALLAPDPDEMPRG